VESKGLHLEEVVAGRKARWEGSVVPSLGSVHAVDTPGATIETLLADLEPVLARRAG
jgi:hypothetical protein